AVGDDGVVKVEIDTAVAKAIYGDTDHRYDITAEVTDKSRRTIVGTGSVLVARKPFKVYAWVDRGHYRVGDVIRASFQANTLDSKPVQGQGELRLLKITYKDAKPVETEVQKWKLGTDVEGRAVQQIKASEAGQYRLSYKVTDTKKHTIEGGYVFVIRGEGFDGNEFRFSDIELVTDKGEYAPGDKVNLMVNADRRDSTVLLFVRPANGICLPPKVLRLKGKSATQAIQVVKKDMPNFFIEAVTVAGGKVYTEMREVIVPPESRVLKLAVTPSAEKYKPGEQAKVAVRLTDATGEPFAGSLVLSIYDKAVEYISGGSNVPEIREFFWKWRRHHQPRTQTSLSKGGRNLVRPEELAMQFLGVFGYLVVEEAPEEQAAARQAGLGGADRGVGRRAALREDANALQAPAAAKAAAEPELAFAAEKDKAGEGAAAPGLVEPTVRKEFADTALWVGKLDTKDGTAEVKLTMPENLTTWKTRVWALGSGARVGEAAVEVITTKNLILRLQAPRFFVQKDEVVLSANVHNYLETKKKVQVVLGPLTKFLKATAQTAGKCKVVKASGVPGVAGYYYWQTVEIPAGGEKRVDWRVSVVEEGQVDITMKALTDEESDAMQMSFPVYVHGMLKTESFCGVIRLDQNVASLTVNVPKERLPEQSRLEVRYSPTLAMAMVDALPYMADYPYGCTEQTLNRFLPTVITQKVLLKMGVDLKDIKDKLTNLNAQEIGDDRKRAEDWRRMGFPRSKDDRNPVWDEAKLRDMVKAGLERLTSMQCADGGWGWWSGWGERSWPHTTALVVHGLQIARQNDVALVPGVLERGVEWLKRYQAAEVQKLKNAKTQTRPWKEMADNLDAFVYMVLADEKSDHEDMRGFLYRDRNDLAVYTKAMFGLALHKMGHQQQRDMLINNVEQFLVQDDENQTAYLRLPGNNWWWCWYGSEYEAHAYYLKLLAAVQPKSEKASRLVKYLLNNRKHATYWNSTRDTALVVEAFADYIRASGEDKPDMTVELWLDGKRVKQVKVNADNLFTFDNKLVLEGQAVTTGKHKIEMRRTGAGRLYFNAYLTNFTLEDPITRAGLEIKVNRKYYKLVRVDKAVKAEGARGQAVDRKVEKYERQELKDLALLKSGDLVEIELEVESKNDYEYIMFEDMKAAGFEPVEVRSGYNRNEMGAYMELRDERVCFFARRLARGRHSVSYRMRAEIPGKFSALPTKASAMYAPELKANSDEIKLRIED
ncbi:MAG: alpha-2-macroglobulin, partial [Phycisphaerae bacterium SM23_33]